MLNPTFASVTPNVGRSFKIWPISLGGAAGQRGPERMAPGGTAGFTSDFPFESPRVPMWQVERVSSRLKVTMPNDSKEWRSGSC